MGIFRNFPYTNFHEMNLDWLLSKMKELGADFIKLADEFKNFVIETEPLIRNEVDKWLDEHPEATTTVLDDSLTTAKYKNGSITEEKLHMNLREYLRYKSAYPIFGGGRDATVTGSYSAPGLSAGINGDATPETLSVYYNRDGVIDAVVAQNNVARYNVIGKQYTILDCDATSVTIDNMDNYPQPGMVVHLFETVSNDLTNGYVGVVNDVVDDKIIVTEWYRMGNDSAPVTPSNVNYAIVNIITRLYGMLIEAVDNADAPEWYRSSFGISTEIRNANPNTKGTYGNIVYIRDAKGENVNAFVANNTSGDVVNSAFGVVGNFDKVLSVNGHQIIDGNGVYVGANAVKTTEITRTTNANGNIATGIHNILACIPTAGDYIILPYSASGNIRVFTNTLNIVASTEITMTIYHL